jgi:hypothetical protein
MEAIVADMDDVADRAGVAVVDEAEVVDLVLVARVAKIMPLRTKLFLEE